jgi:hypothetical protein
MTVFQRAGCGCIGIVLSPEEFLCIDQCDRSEYDYYTISVFVRTIDPDKRDYEPLTSEEERRYIDKLIRLVARGNWYNDIQRLLEIK